MLINRRHFPVSLPGLSGSVCVSVHVCLHRPENNFLCPRNLWVLVALSCFGDIIPTVSYSIRLELYQVIKYDCVIYLFASETILHEWHFLFSFSII